MGDLLLMASGARGDLMKAAREMAWKNGLDIATLESIVAKVMGQADRNRVATFIRPASNDDGGTG